MSISNKVTTKYQNPKTRFKPQTFYLQTNILTAKRLRSKEELLLLRYIGTLFAGRIFMDKSVRLLEEATSYNQLSPAVGCDNG